MGSFAVLVQRMSSGSGAWESVFLLVCMFAGYLLWSKGMSQKGKKIPGGVIPLVISGLTLVFALLIRDVIYLHIAISLCAITLYRMIKSAKTKKTEAKESDLYPQYWTAVTIFYVIYSVAMLIAMEIILHQNYEFKDDGVLLYILVCTFSLIISLIITSLYFMPYFTALKNLHPSKRIIYLLNLFTGWTVVGWGAVLAWAFIIPKSKSPDRRKKRDSRKKSTPDEILKYKKLLEAGAITEEEYQRKKKELLGL